MPVRLRFLVSLLLSGPMAERSDEPIRAKCFHPSGTFVEFSKDEIEQSIPERFEKIVQRFPDRMAVESTRHRMTYRELNQAANKTAHAVLSACGGTHGAIAVLMEHDAPVVAAILGALKAGKFYVPLDPSLPFSRSKLILDDAQAETVITNTRYLPLAKTLVQSPGRLLNVDDIENFPDADPPVRARPGDLCWIIYTSGSTGIPKGVTQNHRNVLHFMMNYTNGLHIGSEDRLTLLYSFSVNGGAHDIFAALFNGAAICPYDLKEEGFAGLGRWLSDQNITIYHSVPTVFRQFADSLTGGEEFPSIRIVRLGGEPVYRRDVNLFKKYFSSDCILVNRLGSSETGSLRMFFLDKATEVRSNLVPVGFVVADNDVLLLDDAGAEVAGDEGEIAVRTRYVSPGYWRRPELTAASFLRDPADETKKIYRTGDLGRLLPDGCLLHLGRRDFFVKIRGYRVELEEIEMTLLEVPGLKECVVAALNNNSGDERLVAYVVPKTAPGPNVSEMRRFLKDRLPDYMIPAAFVFLDALPLTDTLKVDRKALPKPAGLRPEIGATYTPPRNAIEEGLARIWAEVLEIDLVGIHDNFFDLGGHSLAATRIISRVVKAFPSQLSLQSLFDAPTVAEMAEVIASHRD
ncbi:MAG TPA: non-ribosomal peptide synthetase [Candidatus Limnocylindria bacterium]|nr:non-ribosomal peptide synthetase [Candidatus Limnocylindria bacterium]